MEYWTCILGGGTPYSYCGIHAHDVCCFVPVNAEPVGILPTPSHSRCGKKGQDSGRDGEADMAEWPWHVRIFQTVIREPDTLIFTFTFLILIKLLLISFLGSNFRETTRFICLRIHTS